MKLYYLNEIPEEFFDTPIGRIGEVFKGPTLIHLNEGVSDFSPVFISVLLHGNEISGYLALKEVLRKKCERELIIFIANPLAASQDVRFLPGQLDFNRVWSGGDHSQVRVADEVIKYVQDKKLFVSIDIHNNSGRNPFYSCVNKTEEKFLALANFFSPYIVYFTEPHEVQSMAFSRFCPSVTIEAGQSGDEEGVNVLVKKLKEVFEWKSVPKLTSNPDIFHTVARLRIPESVRYSFCNDSLNDYELALRADIEDFNFKEIPKGFILGQAKKKSCLWLEGDQGTDIFEEYFECLEGKIIVKKPFIPAMLTTNKDVISKDCFGYVMEKWLGPKK